MGYVINITSRDASVRARSKRTMSELRDSIKRWEHTFLESHGHKPSTDDIRADAAIRDMYKRYHAAKRAQTENSQAPTTPQKKKRAKAVSDPAPSTKNADAAEEVRDADAETDADDSVTPHQNKVTEIFPTPQFQGRALGLFDLELSPPETPSKRQPVNQDLVRTPKTPSGSQQLIAETPMSKRTPDYFLHRTDIFGVKASPSRGAPTAADSPLVKRKAMRAKSVSELVKEASELQNLQFDGQQDLVLEVPPLQPAEATNALENKDTAAQDTSTAKPAESAEWTGRVRKGPKRQTKKMTMRPVNHSDMPSMAKPTENYKRLKINNNNRGKFRRR